MAEIADLERRIIDALDRIGTGIDRMGGVAAAPDSVDPVEVQALRDALDAEKTANAQLEERVKALREKGEARSSELEAQLDSLKSAAHEAKSQVQQLRKTNQHLQASLATLRDAYAKDVEPHLINQAIMSELEGLRSVRDADRAELDEILGALQPLLKEPQDA